MFFRLSFAPPLGADNTSGLPSGAPAVLLVVDFLGAALAAGFAALLADVAFAVVVLAAATGLAAGFFAGVFAEPESPLAGAGSSFLTAEVAADAAAEVAVVEL